jgi:hypothetical protein
VRKIALLCTFAIAATGMALPSSAAAATSVAPSSGYTYKIVYNYCSAGAAYMKVRETAAGYTVANRLTIKMKAQEKRGGVWRTVHAFPVQSYRFRANGSAHWLKAWANWYNSHYYVRLVFKLQAWNGTRLLAYKTLRSVTC